MASLIKLVVLLVAASACLVNADLASVNDMKVLQYALTLEQLESAFYTAGLAAFPTQDLYTTWGYPSDTLDMFTTIKAHEAAHVAYLKTVIASLGGTPVAVCSYNFTSALSSVPAFVLTAAALETGGQQAYDGAIKSISNPTIAQAAATIATVEARHSAYLNELIGGFPAPAIFDDAASPAAVATLVTPYLGTCPYDVTTVLPSTRPSGVRKDTVSGDPIQTGVLGNKYSDAQKANDLAALNYALTLEHFENAFYQDGLSKFNLTSFLNAGYPQRYYNYTVMAALHEAQHVFYLKSAINARWTAAAVDPCTYNFASVTTVAGFLATAATLEKAGVQAYDGAVNTITDTYLQEFAATIATVEARHAAWLNQATSISPFPDTMDSAATPTATVAAVVATGFISCSYTIVTPNITAYLTEGSTGMSSSGLSGSSGMNMTGGVTGMSSGMTGTGSSQSTGNFASKVSAGVAAIVAVVVAAFVVA